MLEKFQKHFDVFGPFYKISSIFRWRSRIRLIFCCRAVQLFTSKAVWRGLGRLNLMCKTNQKYIYKKWRLPTFCGPQNWQTSFILCTFGINYCILDTKCTFASVGLNFSQKLANVPCGQNVGKCTPLPIWGAYICKERERDIKSNSIKLRIQEMIPASDPKQ